MNRKKDKTRHQFTEVAFCPSGLLAGDSLRRTCNSGVMRHVNGAGKVLTGGQAKTRCRNVHVDTYQ